MPATPYFAYKFLVDNNLLALNSGATAAQANTIENLVGWSTRLKHFLYSPTDPDFRYSHWQYAGLPPPSRIVQGTYYDNPNDAYAPDFGHWTRACQGTSSFYQQILRAVNIPVQMNRVCGDGLPVFRASGLFMTHGDNPYNQNFKASGLAASVLLRPAAEFQEIFGSSYDVLPLTYAPLQDDPSICANVGSDPTGLWGERPKRLTLFMDGFE